MIKALAGRKVYYIYAKSETKKMAGGIDDAVRQVAVLTHERIDRLDVMDAKLIGKNPEGLDQYEIGTMGDYFAVTRR